jgi:hypothetical protein
MYKAMKIVKKIFIIAVLLSAYNSYADNLIHPENVIKPFGKFMYGDNFKTALRKLCEIKSIENIKLAFAVKPYAKKENICGIKNVGLQKLYETGNIRIEGHPRRFKIPKIFNYAGVDAAEGDLSFHTILAKPIYVKGVPYELWLELALSEGAYLGQQKKSSILFRNNVPRGLQRKMDRLDKMISQSKSRKKINKLKEKKQKLRKEISSYSSKKIIIPFYLSKIELRPLDKEKSGIMAPEIYKNLYSKYSSHKGFVRQDELAKNKIIIVKGDGGSEFSYGLDRTFKYNQSYLYNAYKALRRDFLINQMSNSESKDSLGDL